MNIRKFAFVGAIASSVTAFNATAGDIALPSPVREGGGTLMKALAERRSGRAFADREVPPSVLSSLLWAANGINREDGRRTAPTGLNVQDIDVYVVLSSGVYRYDAKANSLVMVNEGDHRHAVGLQDFARQAPLNLVYVQDTERSMKGDDISRARFGGVHVGAIMQNTYLFCADAGLVTVARAYFDHDELSAALSLKPTQRAVLAQTVGYPAE